MRDKQKRRVLPLLLVTALLLTSSVRAEEARTEEAVAEAPQIEYTGELPEETLEQALQTDAELLAAPVVYPTEEIPGTWEPELPPELNLTVRGHLRLGGGTMYVMNGDKPASVTATHTLPDWEAEGGPEQYENGSYWAGTVAGEFNQRNTVYFDIGAMEYLAVGRMVRVVLKPRDGVTAQTYTWTPTEKVAKGRWGEFRASGRAPTEPYGLDGQIYNIGESYIYPEKVKVAYRKKAAQGEAEQAWITRENMSTIPGLAVGTYEVKALESIGYEESSIVEVEVPKCWAESRIDWFHSDELLSALLQKNRDLDHIISKIEVPQKVEQVESGNYNEGITHTLTPDGAFIAGGNGGFTAGYTPKASTEGPQTVTLKLSCIIKSDVQSSSLTYPQERTITLTIPKLEPLGGIPKIVRTNKDGRRYQDGWTNVCIGDTLSVDFSAVTPEGTTEERVSFQWQSWYDDGENPVWIDAVSSVGDSTNPNDECRQPAYTIPTETGDAGFPFRILLKNPADAANMIEAELPNGGIIATAESAEETAALQDPLETEVALDRKVTLTVEAGNVALSKMTWTLHKLGQAGALGEQISTGAPAEGKVALTLEAGDYRFELKGGGYLPYVVKFQIAPKGADNNVHAATITPTAGGKLSGEDPYQITLKDLAVLRGVYGRPMAGLDVSADFNGNGRVDFEDMNKLIEQIGVVSPGAPSGADYSGANETIALT